MSRTDIGLIAAATLVVVTVFTMVSRINDDLGGEVERFGLFAYAAGGLMCLIVAGGLFFLLFYSARNGYDDVDRPDDDPSG
ncbi:MAG: hypothetical protein AAF253_13660 [Pseudomonadota bacterium]